MALPTGNGAGSSGPRPSVASSSEMTVCITKGLRSPLDTLGVTSQSRRIMSNISLPRSFLTVTYCGCRVMSV